MKNIGTVTVQFANSSNSISTACALEYSDYDQIGGFLVQFDTELGDLSLMTSLSYEVSISEYSKSSKVS